MHTAGLHAAYINRCGRVVNGINIAKAERHEIIPKVGTKVMWPKTRDTAISYCRILLHDTLLKSDAYRGRSKKWRDDGTLNHLRIRKPLYGPSQGDETGDWTDNNRWLEWMNWIDWAYLICWVDQLRLLILPRPTLPPVKHTYCTLLINMWKNSSNIITESHPRHPARTQPLNVLHVYQP